MNRPERESQNFLTREALVSLARTFTPGVYEMAEGRYLSVASHFNLLGVGWASVGILKPFSSSKPLNGKLLQEEVVRLSTSRLGKRRPVINTERYILARGENIPVLLGFENREEEKVGDFDLTHFNNALNFVKDQPKLPDTSEAGKIAYTVPLFVFMQRGIKDLIALHPDAAIEGTDVWGLASASYTLDYDAVELTTQMIVHRGRRRNESSIRFGQDPEQQYIVTADNDVVRLVGGKRHDPSIGERAKIVEAIDALTALHAKE
jgi:hypothetical protein